MNYVKIGCLCITENRDPLLDIALASFETQQLLDSRRTGFRKTAVPVLLVLDNTKPVFLRTNRATVDFRSTTEAPGAATVPRRLDQGCKILFEEYGCDLVAMWDDDDWQPQDRLRLIVTEYMHAYSAEDAPFICGDTAGWFVNLRTLWGQFIRAPETFWGDSLAFNRAAWQVQHFEGLSSPGYDRDFVNAVRAKGSDYSITNAVIYSEILPVAFSHGKNIATWLTEPGEYRGKILQATMPLAVWRAVKSAQQFLMERRIYPPQP